MDYTSNEIFFYRVYIHIAITWQIKANMLHRMNFHRVELHIMLFPEYLVEKEVRILLSEESNLNVVASMIEGSSMCISVFHLALSNMAQRHVAFHERHVALHECHAALLECHVALPVRHVALLIFRRWNASLNCCYIIFNPPRPLWLKTPQSLMSRVHTYDAIPDNGLCT